MNTNIEDNSLKQKTNVFGSKALDIAAISISVVVGVLFAILVIKSYIGINLFIFSAAAIAGVGYMLYKDNNLDIKNFVFFGGAFLLYASVFFRLQQEVYTALTFPVLILMLVFTTIFSTKNGAEKGIITFLYRLFGPIARVDKIFAGISAIETGDKNKKQKLLQVVLGVLLAVILLFIVVPLMMSADIGFEKFAENIWDKINWDFNVERFIGKTIAGFVIAVVFCGFLYTFTKDKMTGSKKPESDSASQDNHLFIITVLSIVGAVFLLFAIVQFNSLFASRETVAASSTFAQTAREGYFQLVVLSVINFIMVLVFNRMQKGSSKASGNIIKGLTTYFVVLNVYLLASSAYKMTLYYNAYGLSVERLLVYILLVFELFALVMLLIKIFKNDIPFIKLMIYYTAAFWAVASFINIESWVAGVNVNRYEDTGKIDVEYLCSLSGDASSEIKYLYLNYYDDLSKSEIKAIEDYYFSYRNYGDYEFRIASTEKYDAEKSSKSWLEFNISKNTKYKDGQELLEYSAGK